jgi:hypothetical protein
MKSSFHVVPILCFVAVAAACSAAGSVDNEGVWTQGSALKNHDDKNEPREARPLEDIYVVRSVRLSRTSPVGAFCDPARTSFSPELNDDTYLFKSVTVKHQGENAGLMTDPDGETVGTLHACFGPTADPATFSFYAEGDIHGIPLTGKGACTGGVPGEPEVGLGTQRCYLELSGLPAEYVHGFLTTNTMGSLQSIGKITNPPGYVQSSIATVRLWRPRPADGG